MTEVMFHFSGRNFVVVGASSGMGREIALELAAADANVLAVARNKERLAEVQQKYPERVEISCIDVTVAQDEEWNAALENFTMRHGKIHGGVYTAGTSTTTALRGYDETAARNIMETGFWGAMRWIKAASKKKYANRASSYVLFSSTAGYSGERGLSIYSATKAALRVAIRSLAHDLSREEHCINTVSPGYVRTPMTVGYEDAQGAPEGVLSRHLMGIGEPDYVSGMVLFLLSNRAKWITGEDFIVDGGYLRGAWR